ncbi:MAG: hypothetical protein JSR63_00435 [Proteobacteria bacterium]|nr:hypothetical protein [Pseudomonadota bacterium]MBS0216626.1 hypothetical protein [Pseudomonadota bacterium]
MTLSIRWFLLASLICGALASLLFLPGLHGGFVFDDGANIVDNPAVHLQSVDAASLYAAAFGPQPGGVTRVLPTLSLALDYWRGGLDPTVFKATNIAIHALTTIVLAWFFRALLLAAGVRIARAQWAGLALALAWAVHPLQASSVLYVVQRMQTMSTLFLLLALLAYLGARQAQIKGNSGRTGLMLTGLLWALAFACKEDAIILPAYMLALELTVLRFQAASPEVGRLLRKGYLYATVAGAALYLLVVVPHFWHSDAYPGRDFSSSERLLTQGRVLCMYLWEILLPLPSHMPFYYDWLQPSRGLFQPWTTLPSILLVVSLLIVTWRLRIQRPLLALGILLFFAGHFVTSNVIGLELAFEHRNHFPLIGIVLAVGDLLVLVGQRMRIRPAAGVAACVLLLGLLAGATTVRVRTWSNPLTLARASTELAPHSARAWNSMCLYYYKLGGGKDPANPYLDKAIDICGKGAAAAPYSVTSLVNLIVFKTKRGSVTQSDWNDLLERLQRVNLGPENMRTTSVLMYNVSEGVALNEDGVLESLDIISNRAVLGMNELSSIGYFVLGQTRQPERAYAYFARAVEQAPPGDAFPGKIAADMRSRGRQEWAAKLEAVANASRKKQAVR